MYIYKMYDYLSLEIDFIIASQNNNIKGAERVISKFKSNNDIYKLWTYALTIISCRCNINTFEWLKKRFNLNVDILKRAFHGACLGKNFILADHINNNYGNSDTIKILKTACNKQSLEIIKYLFRTVHIDKEEFIKKDMLYYICNINNVEILRLIFKYFKINQNDLVNENGYLKSKDFSNVFKYACIGDNFDLAMHLYCLEHFNYKKIHHIFTFVCIKGSLKNMTFLLDNFDLDISRLKINKIICHMLIYGHYEKCVKFHEAFDLYHNNSNSNKYLFEWVSCLPLFFITFQ